jgi:hypothetical protein
MIGGPPVILITCPTFEISLYLNNVQLETRRHAAGLASAVAGPLRHVRLELHRYDPGLSVRTPTKHRTNGETNVARAT